MKARLRPLSEQVIVITGATSGIGLVTARLAAQRGASLVLAARNEQALTELVQQLEAEGAKAVAVVADVGNEADVRHVVETALEDFGHFDTWINNAGVSVYGKLATVPLDEARRLFETNFWGTVYGSLAAVEHLRTRGGALINVGSVLSDIAIPLQGFYCASKHAVKGFTDALRMELEREGAPVSVTLIKPSSIATPYIAHAKNYMSEGTNIPPPVYAPEPVAEAILHCAVHPKRDVFVGFGGRALVAMGQVSPRLADWFIERKVFDDQMSDRPRGERADSLHKPMTDGDERGPYRGKVHESSLYTHAVLHPWGAAATALALCVAATALVGVGRMAMNGKLMQDRA